MTLRTREKRVELAETIVIGESEFSLYALPDKMRLHHKLGVVTHESVDLQRICLDEFVCHPRAIKTANADILLFHVAGPVHYGWTELYDGGNTMFMLRSKDGGRSFGKPVVPWQVPWAQHAAVPFRPQGTNRIYCFGTHPDPAHGYVEKENAPLGFCFSDDNGESWSDIVFIRPKNKPDFIGISAMRMTEAGDGSWLLGTHNGLLENNKYQGTFQYLLRSEDSGESWELLPDGNGWTIEHGGRLHEGRVLYLGNNEVLMHMRSSEGHIWDSRSFDNGRNWSKPSPTKLKHLEAPPMLFKLDESTLISFFHNRAVHDNSVHEFSHEIRSELWFCLSYDRGHHWSEPRILAVEASIPPILNGWSGVTPMLSYCDLLVEDGLCHLFIDHEMRQILHASFPVEALKDMTVESAFKRQVAFA